MFFNLRGGKNMRVLDASKILNRKPEECAMRLAELNILK